MGPSIMSTTKYYAVNQIRVGAEEFIAPGSEMEKPDAKDKEATAEFNRLLKLGAIREAVVEEDEAEAEPETKATKADK